MRGAIVVRTLVVDDSSSMRALLTELLAERDYDVVSVGTAEAALKEHHKESFDLLLVDWMLPGISGLDLCRIVRSRPGGDDVVVLVITGRNRPEDLNAVLDAGASDYLSKPIDPDDLRTRLVVAERSVRDARERKEMRARLLLADRMASVGTLAAGVAHELNNPLAYVLSNLRLTMEELSELEGEEWLERSKQQIDEAIHGAERMRHIIRDLKTFSRADDDFKTNVCVTDVLESSISMCWNEIRHRCTLYKEFDKPPLVEANESRLGQVFLNLLINASQAMTSDDVHENSIKVRAFSGESGDMVVQVIDNGQGISASHIKRIFDPFFTTKKQSEGTGLGLSICQNLVRAEGGTIDVRSVKNQGTTFEVRLPATTKATRKKHTLSPPAATSGTRAKIIVIDDEELVGRSIHRALRAHDVRIFTNPNDAVKTLCSDEAIDVVFCDIMMPELSGTEVYTAVEKIRPDVAKRFVFITGGAFTKSARDFLARTPVLCLDKPFDVAQLRQLVRERAEPAD